MSRADTGLAGAITDEADSFISADEPLATLQVQCGGELPGRIAIPELLELVTKARQHQLRLARNIRARSEDETISVWVEVEPRNDGAMGCEVRVAGWSASPLESNDDVILARYRDVIDRQVADLTAILDSNQNVLAVDSRVPDLAALQLEMEDGIGRHWTEFINVDGLMHHEPIHWRLLDGARVTVKGSDRDWRVALRPKGGGAIDPHGFDLLMIAERPTQRTIVDMNGPTQRRVMDRIIGQDVAPVLRQPISRIIANAETIRARLAGPLADDYARYASDIANAGKLLLGLLDDLSDLEVVESDDFTTAPDRIDLAAVARQAAGILGVKAMEKAIVIDGPDENETIPVIAEFRRALQILINVITNAIRYSPAGSRIEIRVEHAGDFARVSVSDEGPGMTAEQAKAAFNKFERLGRSDSGGSGLGLYISRRLARAMGGDLSATSARGSGATFILELPKAGSTN